MDYFEQGGKRAVWIIHRRGGKDLTALHTTCRMAHRRVGPYWHVFPTFAQARKSIWEGFTSDGQRILDLAFPAELVKSKNETEMKIELKNGSIWRLIGSDKIEVVGAGPVGVVFSEYALAKPRAWDLIRPMLAENDGWAAFITTPRGRNHAWERYNDAKDDPRWFCDLKTLPDTKAYDPERTIAEARSSGMPEALIRQEYLCDWAAANVGSIWGDLIESLEKSGGIAEFQHPSDGVFTSWDLGHTDATAIWFWQFNEHRAPDLIDHYECHGKDAEDFFAILDGKGYRYVKHWLPHDARAKTFATRVSALERFMARYPGKVAITPQLSLVDGLQAGRWLLQQPMRIHQRCEDGLRALREYHYEWDEDTKAFAVKPEHDWSSHTADAFRYLALVVKHAESTTRKATPPKPAEQKGHDQTWTLDKLFADNEADKHGRRRI